MRIDAHHHFWRYTSAEYGWIDDAMASIRRDFLPDDLAPEMTAAGIDRVVTVQARQTLAETEWLLEMAAANPWIAGIVGWVPLIDPAVGGLDVYKRQHQCSARQIKSLSQQPNREFPPALIPLAGRI